MIATRTTQLPPNQPSSSSMNIPSTHTGLLPHHHTTFSSINTPSTQRASPMPQRSASASSTTVSISTNAAPAVISPAQPTMSSHHITAPEVHGYQNFPITSNVNRQTSTVILPPTAPTLSVAPPSTQLKWFYLTRFQPHETADNIVQFIASKIKCDSSCINCYKLVRDSRKENYPLTFVSFKLSVPAAIEATITSPHFWPTGISIKPFFARNMSNNKPFRTTGRLRPIVQNIPSPRYRSALRARQHHQTATPLASPFPTTNTGLLPRTTNQYRSATVAPHVSRITSTMV